MASLRHWTKTICKNKSIRCQRCDLVVTQAKHCSLLPNTSNSLWRNTKHSYQTRRSELNLKKITLRWTSNQRCCSTKNLIWEEKGETLIRSPHKDVHVPPVSFAEYIISKLDEYKELECLVDHLTNRTYTAAQLKESSIKVASALAKMNYKKGDVILIFATNCPEYFMLCLACSALGVIVSTANPVYTPEELARQLSHSEAKAVITTESHVNCVREALTLNRDAAQNVKDMIIIAGEADKCRPFKTLLEDDGKDFPENVTINPSEDVSTLPYSSGTTGLPKGVMLTHSNIVANIQQLIEGPMKLQTGEDVLLGLLPLYHIYGLVIVLFGCIAKGAKLIMLPKFEPYTFLESIKKHKITYMHIVPPLALFLAKEPMVEKFDLSSLKTLVSGAAPLGQEITLYVEQKLGVDFMQDDSVFTTRHDNLPIPLLTAYGLTETGPTTHYDSAPSKKGTIGHILPNTVAKIVDPVTGAVCRAGMEGEVVMKGPQVMKGYLKNEVATKECIHDGWFYSGDVGKVDKDGYFTITDRLKELIKYKGFQVAPAELEALLNTHHSIQDAAVIGLKKGEDVGEVPKAFVVLKPDTDVKPSDIQEFVEKHVAPYKRLRGGVEIVESIPKTASGKILRRILRQQMQ